MFDVRNRREKLEQATRLMCPLHLNMSTRDWSQIKLNKILTSRNFGRTVSLTSHMHQCLLVKARIARSIGATTCGGRTAATRSIVINVGDEVRGRPEFQRYPFLVRFIGLDRRHLGSRNSCSICRPRPLPIILINLNLDPDIDVGRANLTPNFRNLQG